MNNQSKGYGGPPAFRIWLCGAFRVERLVGAEYEAVRTAEWGGSSYPRLLLKALLCCPSRQARRESLIEMLWPDTDPDQAAQYLNTATTKLRKVLQPVKGHESLLTTENDSRFYCLEGQILFWVDGDAAFALLKEAECIGRTSSKALSLLEEADVYFSKGLFLQDEEGQWATGRRATMEQARYRCRLWLAEAYEEQRMPGQAETALSLLLEEDPTDEDVLCRLMLLLHQQGKNHQSLRLYEQASQIFEKEGMELAETTRILAEQLRQERWVPLITDPGTEENTPFFSQTHNGLLSRAFILEEPDEKQSPRPMIQSSRQIAVRYTPTLGSTDELLDRFIRAMKKPSTINETTCRYIEARTDGYWKDHYDAIFAPSDLLSDALGQFQKVISLLENPLLPTVRTRLCASVSRIAQFAGSLYFDMGNYTYSKKYRQVAILAAREAENQELEAVTWGRLSMTCMYSDQLQNALINIQEARRLDTQSSSFRVHAWLAAVEAEIQAKQGNREACLESLDVAECVGNIHPSDQDSHWLHFDRPSLIGFQGACYRRLYRPDNPQTHGFLEDARNALLTTLSLPTLTQRRPTTLADLADTYLLQGEIEEACKLASQAVAVIAELQSRRNLQRLFTLRHAMEPWKDTRDIQDLDRQLTALDEQLAQLFS